MEFNLADLVEGVVDVLGDRAALVCGDARLTYAELDRRANRLGHHFAANGIGPGDHVGIQLYNGVEYVETMLACFKVRAVPVNVNYRYVDEELAYLYDDADLVALVFGADLADRVAAVAPRVGGIKHCLVVGEPGATALPAGTTRYAEALAAQSDGRDFPPRSPDDIHIIYTGGTTGMPRGVMWRHEDLFFAGMSGGDPSGTPARTPEEVVAKLADKGVLVVFPAAPLMHGAAQLGTFIGLLQGARIVLIEKYDGREAALLMARERVNTLSIVGDAMARPLVEALDDLNDLGALGDRVDLSSLLAISSAGAILSQAVRDDIARLLPTVVVLDNFGSSETGFQGTGARGSSPDSGLRFRVNERTAVLDDDLRPIAPGSDVVGRIAQRGHVPLGYYGDAEKTAQTFVTLDGERWVILGDLGRVEADGTVSVLGRASACVNTGGEKVFPEEVEAALKGHPDVFDAVVTGVPDPRYGERVAAVVQLRATRASPEPGDEAAAGGLLDELIAHCRTRIAGYKVPRFVTVVDHIQRSPSGKPDYRWAKTTATEAAAASGAAAAEGS